MTEPQIRDYLLGKLPPSELEKVEKKTDGKMRPYYKEVEMIEEGEFLIETRHLINVCGDVLNGKMEPETLDLFSFILIGSDYFTWDSDSGEGQRISEVIFEWNNPTINYPLTIENVGEWKKYLQGHERKMQTDYGRQHKI
jgi:hypothetical protein